MSVNPGYSMTDYQMSLLSNIFRLIIKELVTVDDKNKLAPGELGINYADGTFYIRNPHTGELFSPNSIEHIRQIQSKYDSVTGELNADRISNIKIYTSITQINPLDISYSPDTVIRQMEYPAILVSAINYPGYKSLGYPGPNGILEIFKIDESHVSAKFYDCNSYITYEGQYNQHNQYFVGWAASGGAPTPTFIETVGGGDNPAVVTSDVSTDLYDLALFTVRVKETINPNAILTVNGKYALPLYLPSGIPLNTPILANNTIMLIYDKFQGRWVVLDSAASAFHHMLIILSDRFHRKATETDAEILKMKEKYDSAIKNLTQSMQTMKNDYLSRLDSLRSNMISLINSLMARPGNIITHFSVYTESIGNTDVIRSIPNFDSSIDKLIVNFNQTILRPGVDYVVSGNGITLRNGIRLAIDDTLLFIVIKQEQVVPIS